MKANSCRGQVSRVDNLGGTEMEEHPSKPFNLEKCPRACVGNRTLWWDKSLVSCAITD